MGCVHTEHTNSTHKGVLFQGCIQQPIASFNYMNITALDLWRVNRLELKGNSKLLSNPNQSWDPDTGYNAFFSQISLSPIKGNEITFSSVKTGTDFWVNNKNTAFKWETDHITIYSLI